MRDWDPFICKDCGMAFHDAGDFSAHFVRVVGPDGEVTTVIIGCSPPVPSREPKQVEPLTDA